MEKNIQSEKKNSDKRIKDTRSQNPKQKSIEESLLWPGVGEVATVATSPQSRNHDEMNE